MKSTPGSNMLHCSEMALVRSAETPELRAYQHSANRRSNVLGDAEPSAFLRVIAHLYRDAQ
jgi:hypothetical protein